MGVRLILKDGVLTAVLSGEIDHHSAREIRTEIDSTASKVKPRMLILDFSAVRFMDSSGIGLVMGRCKLMQVWDGLGGNSKSAAECGTNCISCRAGTPVHDQKGERR